MIQLWIYYLKFDNVTLLYVPRCLNEEANNMAQRASNFQNMNESTDIDQVTYKNYCQF